MLISKKINPSSSLLSISSEREILEKYADFLKDESQLVSPSTNRISFPKNIEELSYAVLLERTANLSVSTSRTGLVGGGVPEVSSHLISTSRLKYISEVDYSESLDCHFIKVGSGVTLQELNDYLEDKDQNLYYPVDPTETTAGFGGMVANNSSGARSFYYGSTRDWVLGLKIVLENGEILEINRGEHFIENNKLEISIEGKKQSLTINNIEKPKTKNVISYSYEDGLDYIDLFIGSEGTLGIIAECTLKLTKKPKHRIFYLQFLDSEKQMSKLVNSLKNSKLNILALESIDKNSLQIIKNCKARESSKAIQMIKDEYASAIFADIFVEQSKDTEVVFEKLIEIGSKLDIDIEQSVVGTEEKDIRDIKVFRHAVPENINELIAERKKTIPSLHKISTDMAVPEEHFEELLSCYKKILAENNLEHYIFGHIGDSHLHANIIPRNEKELLLAKKLYLEIAKKVASLQGSVSAEHGIGKIKKDFLKIQYDDSVISDMKKIKQFFDPNFRLSPGVIF